MLQATQSGVNPVPAIAVLSSNGKSKDHPAVKAMATLLATPAKADTSAPIDNKILRLPPEVEDLIREMKQSKENVVAKFDVVLAVIGCYQKVLADHRVEFDLSRPEMLSTNQQVSKRNWAQIKQDDLKTASEALQTCQAFIKIFEERIAALWADVYNCTFECAFLNACTEGRNSFWKGRFDFKASAAYYGFAYLLSEIRKAIDARVKAFGLTGTDLANPPKVTPESFTPSEVLTKVRGFSSTMIQLRDELFCLHEARRSHNQVAGVSQRAKEIYGAEKHAFDVLSQQIVDYEKTYTDRLGQIDQDLAKLVENSDQDKSKQTCLMLEKEELIARWTQIGPEKKKVTDTLAAIKELLKVGNEDGLPQQTTLGEAENEAVRLLNFLSNLRKNIAIGDGLAKLETPDQRKARYFRDLSDFQRHGEATAKFEMEGGSMTARQTQLGLDSNVAQYYQRIIQEGINTLETTKKSIENAMKTRDSWVISESPASMTPPNGSPSSSPQKGGAAQDK